MLLFLVFTLWTKPSHEVKAGGYESTFFNISGGASKDIFENMKSEGVSDQSLMEFAQMEDNFLGMEKESACFKRSRKMEAIALSQQIKERFKGYNFAYHTLHIKQIAEPDKNINKHLVC
tara:strand:+ start:20832 stop:21188 length:357 start_codon:yes stop_codon:yes gene_type:complete